MRAYFFNKQDELLQVIGTDNFVEAHLTEQINNASQLVFSVKKSLATAIQKVCIPSPNEDGFLMFKIITEDIQDDTIEYTCIEAAYDELASYGYVKDLRPSEQQAQYMLQLVLQGTRWELGTIYGTSNATTNFYYEPILNCIQDIVSLFGLELTFTVAITGNKITARRVNMYYQQGQRTGKRFEYGSNALSVTRETSTDELYTALVGRGKGEEVDGDNNPDTPDGYGRKITFEDVEWKKSNGDPLDKPIGQEYLEDPEATKLYGFSDGKPRIGLVEFSDDEDKNILLNHTYQKLKELERPQVQFKAEALDVGDLGLGDTVAIIRHDFHIEYMTRVFKVDHDLLDNTNNTIELGDDLSGNDLTSKVNDISNSINQTNQQISYVMTAADGQYKVNYSPNQPNTAKNGDLWYKDLGNGETELYVYNEGWQLVVSTEHQKEIDDAVDQAMQEMADKEKEINGKLESNQIDISQAQKDLEQAKQDTANQLADIRDSVVKDVADAKAQSKEALDKVNGVDDKASQALENATEAKETVISIATDMDTVKGEISSKADKSTVDAINQTVSDQGTQITQNANDIKSKASSSDVDKLSGRVSTAETTLLQTAQGLTGKADTTQLNKLSGDLTTLSNNFSTTSAGFDASLSKIDDKVDDIQSQNRNLLTNPSIFPDPGRAWINDKGGLDISRNDETTLLRSKGANRLFQALRPSDIYPERTYTLTIYAGVPTESVHPTVVIYFGPYQNLIPLEISGVDIKKYSLSFRWIGSSTTLSFSIGKYLLNNDSVGEAIKVQKIELQEGSRATNYDVQVAKADIKATADNLSTNYTKTTDEHNYVNSQIKESADKINLSVASVSDKIDANQKDTDSKIAALQIVDDQIKSTVASKVSSSDVQGILDKGGYATQKWTGSQIDQKAGEISHTVTEVSNKVDNLQIGGRNYLLGTANSKTMTGDGTHPVTADRAYLFSDKDYVRGKQMMLSIDVTKTEGTIGGTIRVIIGSTWQLIETINVADIPVNTTKRLTLSVTVQDKENRGDVYFQTPDKLLDGSVTLSHVMMVEGNKPTDWSPAPEDMATVTALSKVDQKADSISTTVTNNKNDADSQFTNINQTINGIQSTVASKADASQITQLSNQINLAVKRTESEGTNLIMNGSFKNGESWRLGSLTTWFNSAAGIPIASGTYMGFSSPTDSSQALTIIQNPSQATMDGMKNSTVTLSCYTRCAKNGGQFRIYFRVTDSNGNNTYYETGDIHDLPTGWTRYSTTAKLPSDIKAVNLTFQWLKISANVSCYITGAMLTIGDQLLPYQDGNLDMVNQINLDKSGVLIQGKKIMIDGDTYIKNGVIKSAMIDTLDASKITAGTLNAANVNIINMNVSKLVGDTTNFVQSAWNGISGNIFIDSSSINVIGDWGANTLDSWGIRSYAYNANHNLELVGNFSSTYAVGNKNINGTLVSADYEGDFVGIGYRNKVGDNFTPMVGYFKQDQTALGWYQGTNIVGHLILHDYIKPLGGTGDYIQVGTINFNNIKYAYIGNSSGKAGFAYGSGYMYLISQGSAYRMAGWKIPIDIASDGKVKTWIELPGSSS